jgi:hypothetical protein
LKPDPTRRVDPANPRLEPGMVEEKVGEGKTRSDAVNPARPGQKPGCNPLTFFFIKMTSF